MKPVQPTNDRLSQGLVPYVVGTPRNLPFFDLQPLGWPIKKLFNPLHTDSARFLERLGRLDVATFGPEGMPMPRWVFFDGAELPGGVVGLACPVDQLSEAGRTLFALPKDAQGFVPLSMFIAIPSHQPGTWMGHNLASASPQLPELGLQGLASLTKALGLAVFRTEHQIGVTQWNSLALAVHTRLGPLQLRTAWTPAHSEPWSLTYRAEITQAALRNLAREPGHALKRPEPDFFVDSEDHAAMQDLQRQIEGGARFVIPHKPRVLGPEHLQVPVASLG